MQCLEFVDVSLAELLPRGCRPHKGWLGMSLTLYSYTRPYIEIVPKHGRIADKCAGKTRYLWEFGTHFGRLLETLQCNTPRQSCL